jgi:hypothetical protein
MNTEDKQERDRARDQLIDELNEIIAQFSAEEARLFFGAVDARNFIRAGGKLAPSKSKPVTKSRR